MRQKLEFAKGLLEGLNAKDYTQIARNAKALKALSQAAVWTDTKMRSIPQYGWLSVEFQELADDIAAKAGEKISMARRWATFSSRRTACLSSQCS